MVKLDEAKRDCVLDSGKIATFSRRADLEKIIDEIRKKAKNVT